MKHTPGPWRVETERAYIHIMPSENLAICELWRRGNPELEMANARLIAAAPDLLELLMELQDIVFLTRNNELHTRMEAAIAKATGE
jgi:hypothetical protein